MANPGAGSKFVSVNLNKSYGQRSSNLGGTNRVRSGGGNGAGGAGGGGGGGGMVVLSRSRSSIVGVQKGGPKLSVPPPLNLPSLRKEHERTDPSSLGVGSAGGGGTGGGARPASSGIGWTKPASLVVQEKDGGNDQPLGVGSQIIGGNDQSDRVSRGSSVYMPPSARSGTNVTSVAASSRDFPAMQRAVVLRGEDFPSLQATLPSASGAAQKQKDSSNTKQNQKASAEPDEPTGESYLRPPSVVQPQNQSSRLIGKGSEDKEAGNHRLGNSRNSEQFRKQDDFFPSPLPLVRLNHTSDWADDERDIGNGLPDRDRDQGYSRSEFNWDRDFDFPRSSALPRTSIHDHPEGRGLRHEEVRRPPSGGFVGGTAYNRDVRTPSREGRDGNSWRSSPLVKEGYGGVGNGSGARPLTINRENGKQNKYGQSSFGDTSRDGFNSGFSGTQDSKFARRDVGYGQGVRQTGNHVTESYGGRRVDQTKQDYYGRDLPSHRGDSFQNGSFKGLFTNDPILSVSKEKEKHPTTGKNYFEEPFAKDFGNNPDFDGRDPLTGVLVSVVKRKKDALKQADYHDPVRDSFEAELERVQKLQEQERQRILEEQARALELARKEEEERERAVREEEERRRRHEEEVREAAWRAEQERLDAIRKAEEQRLAREEEKRRMLLEEERRKEAAKKKLMELEARIARRQAEVMKENESSTVKDERMPGVFQDKEIPRVSDVVDWEDGERMVERITSSASSDSSSFNRSFEMSSRPHFYRDGDSVFLDKGKPSNSWRRDVFDNGNSSAFIWQDQDNAYCSPRRDAYGAGRSFGRKEFNGGPGIMPMKASGRGGMPDPRMGDDFSHPRSNRWNLSGEVDPYNRNPDFDPEFHDNFADKFSDMGWGLGRQHINHHPSYSERPYQNSDADGFSSFAKSRHSMRQPRVLPPPSMSAMNKNTFKSQIEQPRSSSGFRDSEMSYHHVTRNSEPILQMGYETGYQDERDRSRMVDSQEENVRFQDQKEDKTVSPRCDSQSSLSVSSAPSSPTHLSHDDFEDSRESSSLPAAAEGEEAPLSQNEDAASLAELGTVGKVEPSSSLSPLEDEEWDVENHRDLLEQEEYDEEENGYREEDEVHEEGDENVDLPREFEDMHLEEKDNANEKDNLVLGFEESVDVVMPSGDNSESKPENGEKAIGIQQVSLGVSEEMVSPDGLPGIGQSVQSGNSPKVAIESSQMTHEAERTLMNAPLNSDTSVSSAPEKISSSISTVAPQQPLSSSVDTALPSISQPITSTVSACPSQTEVPVKLQFGLFSGPSLIPSPVSAIQIGSIQMPLHLNTPVGPSLTQLHPPQPPFFQFGQLRYASPIPQGIVPLGPQSMSFVQSSSPAQYSVNHNQNGSLGNQENQDPANQNNSVKDKPTALSADDEPAGHKPLDQSHVSLKGANASSVRRKTENEDMVSHSQADSSLLGDRSTGPNLTSQVERGYQSYERKNYRSYVANKESHSQHVEHGTSQFISRSSGPTSGNKAKRYVVKNSGSRLSHPVSESSYSDFRGSQRRGRPKLPRTEFRVRENVDKRQRETVGLANYPEADKSSSNGKLYGTSVQRGVSNASKQVGDVEDSNSKPASAQNTGSESRREKHVDKEVPLKKVSSLHVSHSREGNQRNDSFDEDVDAPLQSGIVRVFKQPGIEAPSDDDDFIQVRSKRQMLNDRREQREKEIKAKSRIIKAPKKRRSVSQNSVASTVSNKTSTSVGGEASNSNYSKPVSNESQSLERPTRFIGSVVSPPLAPIGTPSVNSDTQADIRTHATKLTQAGSIADISTVGTSLMPSISYENRNVTVDSVATSLSPWGNARVTQQVMALTQTQLDEAMTPARFEKKSTSVGDRTGAIIEQNKQSKSFSSTSSPLNSLLAGERIQFGAVTSPTIFPLSSHIVSSGMGPPGSCRLDVPIEHNISALENDCSLFFEKDKHLNESCVNLEDCEAEAEAEAAASAVAVAAISSDEIVGSGCSVSVSEAKSFEGAENEGLTSESGEVSNQQAGSQSRVEESLSVALPADLSVETPALSLWPSLPSPQHSTGQILSHFPGVPPSHFPCYEMNPMLGGPIFAFGPHDETTGTQSQSQKSSAPGSGPLGAWQQCHSGVDSFYGPPAGFTGPFISPSGGIPGVQGPPHMVVYNHFTPVGQFGQVGLSFMGATYIPSGKQPDWKHNPTSSTSISEGDMNNLNLSSVQHNPTSMPSSIQHLAPGSPLLPLASPLTMFDMSPFQQSSTDASVQGRWSHFPASPLHSAPLSMPMPQHVEGVLSSSFSQGSSTVEQSTSNRFHESCSSANSDNGRSFSVATSAAVTQFPDDLGLLDTSSTATTRVSVSRPAASYKATIMNGKGQSVATKNLSRSTTSNAGDTSSTNNNSNNSSQSTHSSVTARSSQQQLPTQQYHQQTGYTSQRGTGVSQKASGSEWSQRKTGFQGRNQSAGTEKKVKQIYVAKPTTSRAPTNSSS